MPYDVAFVDSIVASPTVRLNLHTASGGWSCLADGTEMPPPERERVTAESMQTYGGRVVADTYRNRTLTLALELDDSLSNDAAATLVQSLIRELDRQDLDGHGNILRYRPDVTAPVFFKTFPSGPNAIIWDPAMPRRATVSILAEPFAYGLEESVSPATVTNNPAAGSNGQFFDIASPKGDVETPLTLSIANGTVGLGVTGRVQSAIAIRRRGTVANVPFFLQAEAMTQGVDTTTQPNSASFSGSGNNFSKCTFATATSGQRRVYTSAHPASASVDARGTYRVYVRLRMNTLSDSIDVALQWGTTNNVIVGPIARLPGNIGIQFIDLGIVQIPTGFDPVAKRNGVEISSEGPYFEFYVRRNSGSGTLDIDYFLFVPADDRSMTVLWPSVQLFSSDVFVIEGGDEGNVYCLSSTGTLRSVQTIETTGGGLFLQPGVTNRVYFIRDVGAGTAAAGTGDVVTATHVITATYHPRYLAPLRPATT